MSIHVILGKPGSGKSLYATSRVLDELVNGSRNVVTNLPLHPGRLNEYIQQKHPQLDARLVQRLRILTDDEIKSFWDFRGPDGDKGAKGVAYFLDEAHIAFNAREWASLGKQALHYLSQHRKLGDVVWPITQAAPNLDKQFRSVAEDFTVLRNEYNAKYGIFKGRGRFVRRSYNSEPTANAEPFETATFTLDKTGIATCYDTAKGIGVHGSKADIGSRAKGINILWVLPGALVLAACCFLLPWALGKASSHAITGGKKPPVAIPLVDGVASASTSSAFGPARRKSVEDQDEPEAIARLVEDRTPERPLWVTGYVVKDAKINVQLSDGRFLTEKDKELQTVERNSVTLNTGQRLYMLNKRAISADSRQAERFAAPGTPTPAIPDQVRDVSKVAPVSGS
jgi:hypothetical protein